MTRHLRNRELLISDIILLVLAAYLSYVLRLERLDLTRHWRDFEIFTLVTLLITPLVFRFTGIYSRYWPYASVNELLLLIGAISVSGLATGVVSMASVRLISAPPVPRSIPFIFLLLGLALTAGPRLAVRMLMRPQREMRVNDRALNVLVIGAGEAGSMMVRELQRNAHLNMKVAGFVDDDRKKHGVRIHGIPVLGDRHEIPQLVQEHNIGQVIIAMPTAPGKTIREIASICEQTRVQTKIMPGVYELLGGRVSVKQLRDVQIEDLLRRELVATEIAAVTELVRGRRVLITGGGGSIGSELCRQLIRCGPSDLVVLGHGENSIFDIYGELRRQKYREGDKCEGMGLSYVHTVIADIRFTDRIRSVFEEHRPEIVFHAAAHKHVPLMEANPIEAVTNNILGTRNLLDAALAVGVERFVMISSDKAVNPSSIMGVCKRAAELLVHQAARMSGKPYVAVRFGNVLGSRGSVVHTFRRQIAAGGPVTITHPDMTRYFMTIPEAVQLVLQAAVMGQGSEVFLLDMGEPVKIVDLARDLIELSGLEVGRDIDIIFTSLRPGEKLFEELFVPGERYSRTRHKKIFVAGNTDEDVKPAAFESHCLNEQIERLEDAVRRDDRLEVVELLKALVPQFQPSNPDWQSRLAAGKMLEPTSVNTPFLSAPEYQF